MLEGRKQPRIPRRFLAQVFSPLDPRQGEFVSVENVSLRGARVATVRAWARNSQVVVKFTSGELRAKSARVVYCQVVNGKQFAVGLEFLGPWIAA
jgi:PilZ domain